jgi:hypothetical protein
MKTTPSSLKQIAQAVFSTERFLFIVGQGGIADLPAAVHAGAFDWLCSLLLRCRGDIQSYGARSALRRGIPLDQHHLGTQLLLD